MIKVENMSFSVPPGAVVGIIGGNGAGKSTLFRMIMNQVSPKRRPSSRLVASI